VNDVAKGSAVKKFEAKRQRGKTQLIVALGMAMALPGCHKSQQAFQNGAHQEPGQNVDTVVAGYAQALKKDPQSVPLKLKAYQAQFEAAQVHVSQGIQFLHQQQNQMALKEFETALTIDPSSMVARQELEYTRGLIAAQTPTQPNQSAQPGQGASPTPGSQVPANPAQALEAATDEGDLMETPPALSPLSSDPLSLKMTADTRTIFRTLGKLAGVNVIFDPDFQEKKVNVDLTNVTIQQALNVVCVESKAFWKPVSSNIILVLPDTPGKRKEQEEQVLQKIYLQHTQTPQEITEIMTSLQQMLELRHVQAIPRDNAILIRDTPAKIRLASRLIHDSDRGRPEVVVQISVLQVRRDRARSLGIQPSSTAVLAFNPAIPLGPVGSVALNKLSQLSTGDFSLSMPSAVASALLTDSSTKIIQNPEVRVSDGESARLRVGDRIPIATGSFQATTGIVGVNTQFQYIDVGVNIDLVPHVHPDNSISMKLGVEVSSLNGQVNIGGVEQPIISQRRIDHDIRLQEGEVSILGGLAEHSQTKSVSGWPGLSRLPLLRYLFSGEDVTNSENEILIVVNPRLVRMREITSESLKALSVGTDSELMLRQKQDVLQPAAAGAAIKRVQIDSQGAVAAEEDLSAMQATVQLEPTEAAIKAGESTAVQVKLENVEDLFSASLILKFDPQVLAIDDVRNGDFLSGGTQEVAIMQRVDNETGLATIFTTRQPNTAGVQGKGTLLKIMVRHLTTGPTTLQVTDVGCRNSRQKIIPITITHGLTTIQ
jgi:general secretion pathway protein D